MTKNRLTATATATTTPLTTSPNLTPLPRALLAAALLLVGPGLAFSQEPGPGSDPRDPGAELKAIVQRLQDAQQAWMKAYRAAETDAERSKLIDSQPGPEFVDEFQELADGAVGTEAAGEALMWVLRVGRDEEHRESCKQAVEVLIHDYVDSPVIAELPVTLRYGAGSIGDELCRRGLKTLVDDSSEPVVLAPALFNLAGFLLDAPQAGEPEREQARALLTRLKETYGDQKDSRGRTYATLADGVLGAMDIIVGKPVPDIEGKDADGVSFKLSDYRGKVVLLDFWGHW